MKTHTFSSAAPFFAVAFVATSLANYTINKIGQRHYDTDDQKTIFDFGHIVLPRWSVRDREILLLEAIPLLSVFIKGVGPLLVAVPDIMVVFGWVLMLRILTSMTTILPRDDECDPDTFGLKQVVGGYCFDKLFSGHTAFAVVVAMVLTKHGIWSPNLAWMYPVWMGVYLLLTRGHYTSDVILGAIIAFLLTNFILFR